jgi:hypothetical protein
MKRVLIVSDLHCGHRVGLTPPGWQEKKTGEGRTKHDKFVEQQRACWDFYESHVKKLGPFDVLIANGDLIDGRGDRSGGVEQITLDRDEQAEIAVYALRKAMTGKTKAFCTYGTAYHTGKEEDWESLVASDIGARIGGHEWVDVDGVILDCKHHVGSSSVPHGRHTAVARDMLWNLLWHANGLQPKGDVFIRSHVHYHNFCGGPGQIAMTTPALQGYGTKYGSRVCSGIVDFGLIVMEAQRKEFTWKAFIMRHAAMQATAHKA